ncbi:MAG TPA: ABC transporter ATP-binding protein [Planctomycetota bacterium]|nr:ABC transporter ATP-binding protein [Planctomycetota bacterium]
MTNTATATSAKLTAATQQTPVRAWAVIGGLLRPHRGLITLALVLNAIHGIALCYQTYTIPMLVGVLEKHAGPGGDLRDAIPAVMWLAGIYILVSAIGRMTMWHLGYRISAHVREKVLFELRAHFFRHVNHLCLRFHRNHSSGELFSYLFGTPLAQITQFFQTMALHVTGAVFSLITSIVILSSYDPYLTAFVLAMVVTSVVTLRHSLKAVNKLTTDFQATEGSVSGHISDLLHGNKAVKLYAMEEQVAHDFEDKAKLLGRKSYERDIKTHMEFMKQELVTYIGYGTLMVVLAWRYQAGAINLTGVTAYMMYFMQMSGPVNQIFGAVAQWTSAKVSLERIGLVLHTASTTPEPVGGELEVPDRGDLVFEQVTFAYGADSEPVIRDLQLTIPYGQRVAIVGPSGAGKSTIIQLLMRLYDPGVGRITIDGVDLRRFAGPNLRRKIGVVPQDPFIFRTNIRENVRVANPEADLPTIRKACELANAWEFIEKLPEGLSTPVGEGGSTLSGGQRQRLAIARVLLANPSFLIFDEATSALDTVSEQLIQSALEKNLVGRTAIFIAHRLATVKNCDRILVLRDGQLVQDGPYSELIAKPGPFRTLVESQQLRMDKHGSDPHESARHFAAAASSRMPAVK